MAKALGTTDAEEHRLGLSKLAQVRLNKICFQLLELIAYMLFSK